MIRALIVMVAATHSATAQTDVGLELLGRIRQHVKASITGLPNYTCQETMERAIYDPAGRIEFRERLRLEVLVTEASELFAWPGSTDFTAKPLESWIGGGAIGTGNFGAALHNIFIASTARIKYVGLETRDQRSLHRFDFYTPFLSSRYTLAVNGKSAITAYSGSFWANRELLDVLRLEMRAEEIPPNLDCRESREFVSYGRIRLGVGERLLPSAAELTLVSRDGGESRNSVAFSKCRHYTAATSLSFTMDAAPEVPVQRRSQLKLPADVALVLRLDQPISTKESAAGDQIVARLDKAVISGGVLLPKGTRVLGRIRRLEQHFISTASILVGLEFFAAEPEPPDGRVTFSAHLTGPRATPDAVTEVRNRYQIVRGTLGLDIEDDGRSTGVGSFRVPGKELSLPSGFRTLWKTQ